MKNRLFSILMTLLIAFPIMSYGLPQDTLNGSQQKHLSDSVQLDSREIRCFDIKFSPVTL